MIVGINLSKTLTKHTLCKCNCEFDGKNVIQVNEGIMKNVDVNVKNVMYVKKIIFGIVIHVVYKMENI